MLIGLFFYGSVANPFRKRRVSSLGCDDRVLVMTPLQAGFRADKRVNPFHPSSIRLFL